MSWILLQESNLSIDVFSLLETLLLALFNYLINVVHLPAVPLNFCLRVVAAIREELAVLEHLGVHPH